MPNIKEYVDSKDGRIDSSGATDTPSVKEMRASQAAGAEGKGTAKETLGEAMGKLNQGSGE